MIPMGGGGGDGGSGGGGGGGGSGVAGAGETLEEEDVAARAAGHLSLAAAFSYIDLVAWAGVAVLLGALLKVYCDRRHRYQRLYSTDAARAVVADGFNDIIAGAGGGRSSMRSSLSSSSTSSSGERPPGTIAALGFGSGSLTAVNVAAAGGARRGTLLDDPYALSSDDEYSVDSSNTEYG
jgi:hypothetical protein